MKHSQSQTRLSPRHLTGMLAAIQATAVVGMAIAAGDGPAAALVVIVLGSLLAALGTGVAAAALFSAGIGLVIPDGFAPVRGRWCAYLLTGMALLFGLSALGAVGGLHLIGGTVFLWSFLMSEALAVEWIVNRERNPGP